MQFPVEPPQVTQRALEGVRVGDYHAGGQHGKVAHTHVHADHGGLAVAGRALPLDLDGEGHEPAVGGAGDSGGQDAGGALLQAAGELAGGLVGLERADPEQRDVLAVSLHPKWSGDEAAGITAAALALRSWEAHPPTPTVASLGVREVLEGASEAV